MNVSDVTGVGITGPVSVADEVAIEICRNIHDATRIFTGHALIHFRTEPGRVRARISEEEALRLVLDWVRSGVADAVGVETE